MPRKPSTKKRAAATKHFLWNKRTLRWDRVTKKGRPWRRAKHGPR